MKGTVALTFVLGVVCMGSSIRASEPPVVKDPWVVTDKSVDTRTVDSILKGLIKDGMSDEEKALAVFNWVRRLIYHGDGQVQYAYNFFGILNIYGHGSCLRQTTPMWVLLNRLGTSAATGPSAGTTAWRSSTAGSGTSSTRT